MRASPWVALGMLASSAAAAADFGPAEQAHLAYNRLAERIGSISRMSFDKCEDRAARYCDYTVTGNLVLIATAPPGAGNKAQILTLIYAKGSDAEAFTGAIGLAMATWSPFSTADQRGQALKELTRGAGKAVLAGTEYRLQSSQATGVSLTLTRQ